MMLPTPCNGAAILMNVSDNGLIAHRLTLQRLGSSEHKAIREKRWEGFVPIPMGSNVPTRVFGASRLLAAQGNGSKLPGRLEPT